MKKLISAVIAVALSLALSVSAFAAASDVDALKKAAPIGKGLLGHAVGETVEVETPGGVVCFVIQSISK